MNRSLTKLHSRSLLFLYPIRSLSSFDFKSRVLLNHINQLDPSKSKSSVIDLTYGHHPFFPLPGHVGFNHKIKHEQELINHTNHLELHTYDCSLSLRSELHRLFLNYNTLTQPLTAITIIFKTKSDMATWSIEVENERHQLTKEFIKLACRISNYLKTKQYWVDFIDPSNGKPYYGPSTSDVLSETDERFRYFGINIVDLGCCRVIEHLQHGTHVFIGCIFTSAPMMDSNIQYLLKEFPHCST